MTDPPPAGGFTIHCTPDIYPHQPLNYAAINRILAIDAHDYAILRFAKDTTKVPEVANSNAPEAGSTSPASLSEIQARSDRDALISDSSFTLTSAAAPSLDANPEALLTSTEPAAEPALPEAERTVPDIIANAGTEFSEAELLTLPENGSADSSASPITNIIGTDADDVITFTADLRDVQGGAGTDTLVVATSFAGTSVILGDDAGTLRFNVTEGSPELVLQDVERISFEDSTLAFDEAGLAGQAYRLYQACFDRTPDAEGLGFWINQLDTGAVTLKETAELFLNSAEFADVYGAPAALADVHYLALLYANVLDRVPDSDGFGFWREEQEKGVTRADMLVYFSESFENVAQVAPAIDDGIWYV